MEQRKRKTRSDKGKKRIKKKDNPYLHQSDILHDTAEEIEKAERQEAERIRRFEETGSFEKPKAKTRNQKIKEARAKWIPQDKICPLCKNVVIPSRSWVIGKNNLHKAICRSCYFKNKPTST